MPNTYILKRFVCIIILLSIVLSNITYATAKPPKNPNSAKGCALCHYRWIDTFFVQGKGSDLVQYHSEKVAASSEMCFSCHDGSVMDSRVLNVSHLGHKTNISPPSFMKVPKIFPLDENNKIQCGTCHTAHGVPSNPGSDSSLFMRTTNNKSQMCIMCHTDMERGNKKKSHPTNITMKDNIKMALGTHRGRNNDLTCKICHAPHGSNFKAFLADNPSKSKFCLSCHNDKYYISSTGKRKPFHGVNLKPVKAIIPKKLLKMGAKLDKKGEIVCRTCHKVHNSKTEKNLLIIKNDKNSVLCLTCHKNKQYVINTKHNLVKTAPKEKNMQGKTAKETGLCSACHLPHKSARELSGKEDITTQICLSCHSKGKVAGKVILSGKNHPLKINLLAKSKINFSNVKFEKNNKGLPLYNKSGVEDPRGDLTCATCHATHGVPGKNNNDTQNKLFLRKKQSLLCKSCHADKFEILNSKHDLYKPSNSANKKEVLSETNICKRCHSVHNVDNRFLLIRKTIEDNVCLGCHNKNGVAKEKLVGENSHPVDVPVFEKDIITDLPLYYNNSKKPEKGFLKCYTCHNFHKGTSKFFLRIENSPSSELCKACHQDQGQVLKTDHDLVFSSPKSKNIRNKTPAQSGTCGVCHVIHNGINKTKLWARNYGKGDNIYEKLCNSCHSKEGIAKNKVPESSTHPKGQLIKNINRNEKGKANYFPIFSSSSIKPVNTGNISCPSCHNVHQWSSVGSSSHINAKKNIINIEGNAANSFLRSPSATKICKDCHGIDSLFRFKYYHKKDIRVLKND